MARKGSTKGYSPPPIGSYSWAELLGRKPIIPAITSRRNTQDGRALEFYHLIVAPAFSRFPGDDFWTRMVAQASMQEPAVRHAVVAISSIYELTDDPSQDSFLASQKGRFALVQYNRALQQITQISDESVVLFVCILFIAIESLRENKQAALTHCQYGIKVYNNLKSGNLWARDYFRPIYVRLTACPFFFGASLDAFPCPVGTEDEDISGPHSSYSVCRYRLDLTITRCIRFIRQYEAPAPGTSKPPPDYSRYHERRARLLSHLADWTRNFDDFVAANPYSDDNQTPYTLMRIMSITSRAWISACAERSEMAYDKYIKDFKEVVRLAGQAHALEKARIETSTRASGKSKFTLDMGFIPSLYFVVIKCRDLKTRLRALYYMADLAPTRENLWNSTLMVAVGKRVIELEHGVMPGDGPPDDDALPHESAPEAKLLGMVDAGADPAAPSSLSTAGSTTTSTSSPLSGPETLKTGITTGRQDHTAEGNSARSSRTSGIPREMRVREAFVVRKNSPIVDQDHRILPHRGDNKIVFVLGDDLNHTGPAEAVPPVSELQSSLPNIVAAPDSASVEGTHAFPGDVEVSAFMGRYEGIDSTAASPESVLEGPVEVLRSGPQTPAQLLGSPLGAGMSHV
ncbi:hypothetical protein OQA88_2773 [Cercophora sp. LCS_1]